MEVLKSSIHCPHSKAQIAQGTLALEGVKLVATSEPGTFTTTGAPNVVLPASSVKSPPLLYNRTYNKQNRIATVTIKEADLTALSAEFLT